MNSNALLTYINRNCPRLADYLSHQQDAAGADRLLTNLEDSANPRWAAGCIDNLLGLDDTTAIKQILQEQVIRRVFLSTIAGSRFLASVLTRNPKMLDSAFLQSNCFTRKTRADKERELVDRLQEVLKTADLDRALRMYKEEEFLRIGCRDLSGLADVQEVMVELSDLAAAILETAIGFHWKRLVARHGKPQGLGDVLGFVAI